MYKYILKRILILIPIVLLITVITFSILSFAKGDPATIILGTDAPKESIDALNEKLGYYDPFVVRLGKYLVNAVQGDFGISYKTKEPVFDDILKRFPYTVKLDLAAMAVAIVIGIPLGVLSAVKQYSIFDYIGTTLAISLATIPGFWLGLILMLIFSLWFGLVPSSGVGTAAHYILPALTLGIPAAASIMRMTRTTMLETIRQDYIRTARGKGTPERVVIWRHSLKNALLPILTVVITTFGRLLGGTVLIESVFAMPGLGSLVVEAVNMRDMPVVMGTTIFLAAIFTIILLVLDILYALFDPRIRSRYT